MLSDLKMATWSTFLLWTASPKDAHLRHLPSHLGYANQLTIFWDKLNEVRGIPDADIKEVRLFRYLDDITLITPPTVANTAFDILRQTLTDDGMFLNEEHVLPIPRME